MVKFHMLRGFLYQEDLITNLHNPTPSGIRGTRVAS